MQRADKDLAFILQYENIAWYENGYVKILDRRIYPAKKEYVICHNHNEVRQVIADMVTQSAGPYTAAAMGMALAAYECKDKAHLQQIEYLTLASNTIANARPTTAKRMFAITQGCLNAAKKALDEGKNVSDEILSHAIETNNKRYNKIYKIAEHLLNLMPHNAKVLTQCFGETIVGQLLKAAKTNNKALRMFCAETRPYFQGARLTASVAIDMGFDVTVVTDNMPAFLIQQEKIDVFTSAADAICLDGYVVNKVGTFQIAIVAKYMGIPYFVTGAPDLAHPAIDSVNIEMRNPDYVLQAMGIPTTKEGVKGYYPAFDITPPHLISGVVTDCGVLSPYDLKRYYKNGNEGEYEITV